MNRSDAEIWRPVPGHERYQVSSWGHIRGPSGQLCGAGLDRNGYHKVSIIEAGKQGNYFVHRLVALAFHGPCPDGLVCDHIDRDRRNNRPDNLRYVSQFENVQNADSVRGESHGGARLTEAVVREILAIPPAPRYGRRGKGVHPNSVTAIAARYGLGVVTVHQIRRGERWRHVYEAVRGASSPSPHHPPAEPQRTSAPDARPAHQGRS